MSRPPRCPATVLASLVLAAVLAAPAAAQLSVTPDGAYEPNRLIHTSGWTAVFTVANNGTFGSNISLSCAVASVVTSCSVQSSITIAPGTQANVNVTYSVGNVGTGTVTLRATGIPGTDEGYYNVPVTLPAGAPRISALPYVDAKQDLGRCAASCFAATYAQSTVPYFSLDQPRNVTLVYHGDRVKPRPFVHVNVAPDSSFGTWPSEYQLQVKVSGVMAKFVNGDTLLRFTNPANLTYRIGGQLDTLTTNSLTDGVVYPMEILVTSKIGASTYTNRWVTQYLTVNETASPIARGWTLAGIQRAYLQADSSVLIKEGDGSAVYFKKVTPFGVTSWESPSGEFSSLTKSGTTFIRAYPDSTKVTFSNGLMVRIADRWGSRDTVLYDGSQRPTTVRDPANQSITLGYGTNGLSTITDPGGRVTNVTVQANKTLTAIRDPDSDSTRFGYDGQLRLSTITDRRGKATTLGYLAVSGKETNKLVTVTAPAIPVNTGGTASPVTTFAPWHTAGVPYATTVTTPLTPPRADTVYGRITEPLGASYVTKFTVNRWGSPLVTTNPLGEVTTITYTTSGRPATIVKPGFGGVADSLIYNGSGLVTKSRPAGDSATTVTYGGWAQPATVATPGRPTVTYSLGANGRVNSVSWGSVTRESYTYDSFGRLRTVTNGVGTVVRRLGYATTGMQNQTADTLPGGRIATYAYDSYGRRTTVTPPASSAPQEVTHYSVINRVDSVRVLTNPVTRTKCTYDKLYLTGVTDPKNQVYGYVNNDLGWLIKQVDPVGARDTFQYNVGGELKRTTNRRNQNVDFSYDVLHRLTSRTGSVTTTWTYTANSLVWSAAVSGVSTVTTYPSKLGVPDSVLTVLAGSTYKQRYRYTSAGLDSVWFTGSQDASHLTGRKYVVSTSTGALTTIRLNGNATSLGYDNALDPTSFSFPGGASRSLTQATIEQPTKSTTEAANNTTLERWIGLDTLGRITRHLRSAAKIGWWFTYDSLGQLRTARTRSKTPDGEPGGCPTADYGMHTTTCTPAANYVTLDSLLVSYDAAGNRTDKGGTYTTGNRLTAFDNCSYKTDAQGNVVRRYGASCAAPLDTLLWTAEGRLDSLKIGATGVKFLYDAFGRLTVKRVNGAVQAYLLWDGDNLLAQLNSAGNAVVVEYSYYPGLDHPHALIKQPAGTRFYARLDGLGNVIGLTNESNQLQRSYSYDYWGKSTGGTDTEGFNGTDRARWKGALWLGSEAELYFMRNRWYEPQTGRFLSEDPIGLNGGVNPTTFGGGDPINGADPSGLDPYRLDDLNVTARGGFGGIPPWLIDTWYRNWLGSGPAEYMPGGRVPGLGGAVRQASRPATRPAVERHQCDVAIGVAIVTAVGDAVAISSGLVGLKLLTAGIVKSIVIGNSARWMTPVALRVGIATADKAVSNGVTQLATAAGASVASDFPVVWAADANGLGASILDFVPGISTVRAVRTMRAVCAGN